MFQQLGCLYFLAARAERPSSGPLSAGIDAFHCSSCATNLLTMLSLFDVMLVVSVGSFERS